MKEMLKQELQLYLDRVFPETKIDTENTIVGKVHIRFELGGEVLKNGTKKRVKQATERSLIIFNETFSDPTNEIFIFIYEFQYENVLNTSNDYLHKQFQANKYDKFYNLLETINTGYFIKDENGNIVSEKNEVRIIIGKVLKEEINIENILKGIANLEMGFDPGIDQRIFFFDPSTDKAFHMYDDRGCFVWSDNADKIRDIYIKYNDWIVDYHRLEIDEHFKK